jgi:hypothetical protein
MTNDMKTNDPVEVVIADQGGVMVHAESGIVRGIGPDVAAILVDCPTKRFEVSGSSYGDNGPEVFLSVGDETLHYNEALKDDSTLLCFPQFKGWSLWCASVDKYTLALCFVNAAS